jgi:hypothetical protein
MSLHESEWKEFLKDERARATVEALRSLPDEEPPRRIAFVSDKVFEPAWWRRLWAAPKWGFASAAMLSGAIVFHAVSRPAPVVVTQPAPAVVQTSAAQAVDVEAVVRQAVAEVEKKYEARTAELIKAAEERMLVEHRQDVLAMERSNEMLVKKLNTYMRASYDRGDGQ